MSRKNVWHLWCADCGKGMHVSPGSLPQGEATCHPCRRLRSKTKPSKRTPCLDCEKPSWGERCRPCEDAKRRDGATGRDPEKRRLLQARRTARDRQAPGLTQTQRIHLLATWQKQGRGCAYCPGPAETIDHVIPLALGGTNQEGNLVPACIPCNNSKNDSLIAEWRHKRKAPHLRVEVDVVLKPKRKPKPKRWVQSTFKLCVICSALHLRLGATCSDACAVEANVIRNRNIYRQRVGIPLDAVKYSVIDRNRRAS